MDDPGPSAAFHRSFPETGDGPVRPPSPPTSPLLAPSQTNAELLDSLARDSLYAVLNVSKTASDAQIRDAYRSLVLTYHPDRQRSAESREAAHRCSTEIQRAYEVLSDPSRRFVYDMFGEEGLRTSWEVGPRNKTPEEMRQHFAAQAYEKKRMDAESLVKPKGDMTVVLDARAVFLPRKFFRQPEKISHTPWGRIQRIRPGRVMMKHSFEMPIDPKTQLVWAGQMVSRSGAGGANVVGTVRHQFSPKLWGEIGSTFLQPRIVTGKATFTYDENTFVTVNTIQQTPKAPPTFTVMLGRRIFAQTTGLITFKSGFWTLGPWGRDLPPQLTREDRSALSVGLTTGKRDGTGWTVETQAGLTATHITADWSTKVLGGLKVKIGGLIGTEGINAFVDGEGRVTPHIRAGMMVQLELGGGVTMSLKFSRLGQKIALPILLSQDLNPYVVLGSTVIPAISYVALYRFYLMPRKRRRIAERVKELRDENKDYIEQKKAEAAEAVLLMQGSTTQKANVERERHGLIILSAHYGPATAFTDRGIRDHPEEEVIDVTIPLQALVSDGRLNIPGGRGKYNLLGFYDPCIGENKKLRVRYLFRDTTHQVTIDDVAPLRLPLRAHALA